MTVAAHTGLEGNEVADALAKAAALEPLGPTYPMVGPAQPPPQRFELTLARQEEGSLKGQLRCSVVDWLAREYRLGHVYHDIWTDPAWLEIIDADASTWMWRYGGDIPRAQLIHAIRMRTAQFVCNYWLHQHKLSVVARSPAPG
jgi:hypothetical protein